MHGFEFPLGDCIVVAVVICCSSHCVFLLYTCLSYGRCCSTYRLMLVTSMVLPCPCCAIGKRAREFDFVHGEYIIGNFTSRVLASCAAPLGAHRLGVAQLLLMHGSASSISSHFSPWWHGGGVGISLEPCFLEMEVFVVSGLQCSSGVW